MVLLRERKSRLVGFIEACLPSPGKVPPSGSDWIHQTKHDATAGEPPGEIVAVASNEPHASGI